MLYKTLINLCQQEFITPTTLKIKDKKAIPGDKKVTFGDKKTIKDKTTDEEKVFPSLEISSLEWLQSKISEAQAVLSNARLLKEKKSLDDTQEHLKFMEYRDLYGRLQSTTVPLDIPSISFAIKKTKSLHKDFDTLHGIKIGSKRHRDTKKANTGGQAELTEQEKINIADMKQKTKTEVPPFPLEGALLFNWPDAIRNKIEAIFSRVGDEHDLGIVEALTKPENKNMSFQDLLSKNSAKLKFPLSSEQQEKYQALFNLRNLLNKLIDDNNQLKTDIKQLRTKINRLKISEENSDQQQLMELQQQLVTLQDPKQLRQQLTSAREEVYKALENVVSKSKESLSIKLFGRKGKVGTAAQELMDDPNHFPDQDRFRSLKNQ